MSAARLREAAALMRSRAEAVVPDGNGESWFHPSRIKACLLAWPGRDDEKYGAYHARRDAEHMASWHPAVALAVAMLLEEHADGWDAGPYNVSQDDYALAVANAYLGGDQ